MATHVVHRLHPCHLLFPRSSWSKSSENDHTSRTLVCSRAFALYFPVCQPRMLDMFPTNVTLNHAMLNQNLRPAMRCVNHMVTQMTCCKGLVDVAHAILSHCSSDESSARSEWEVRFICNLKDIPVKTAVIMKTISG